MATYEDLDSFPSVDWDDEHLFNSFLNPNWLSDNTGDVAMHVQEVNEYSNNCTTDYNFDYTQDVAQAAFGASWGTSSAIAPFRFSAESATSGLNVPWCSDRMWVCAVCSVIHACCDCVEVGRWR